MATTRPTPDAARPARRLAAAPSPFTRRPLSEPDPLSAPVEGSKSEPTIFLSKPPSNPLIASANSLDGGRTRHERVLQLLFKSEFVLRWKRCSNKLNCCDLSLSSSSPPFLGPPPPRFFSPFHHSNKFHTYPLIP